MRISDWSSDVCSSDLIAALRQAPDLKVLPVGRRVVVIGGGNTAIDIAVQTRRLGAEEVTLVYRRGPEALSATHHEQDFAQTRSEEHTSELQSLMRISYAVFCLKKKKH